MEEIKELSIKTVPVEIKVITVDGKRMTKSVVSQIPVIKHRAIVYFDIEKNCFVWKSKYIGWCWYKEPHMSVDGIWCLFSLNGTLVKIKHSDIKVYGAGIAPFIYAGEYREYDIFYRLESNRLSKKVRDGDNVTIQAISIDEFNGDEEEYKNLLSDFNSKVDDINEFRRLLALASQSIKDYNDFVRSMDDLEHQIYISI